MKIKLSTLLRVLDEFVAVAPTVVKAVKPVVAAIKGKTGKPSAPAEAPTADRGGGPSAPA